MRSFAVRVLAAAVLGGALGFAAPAAYVLYAGGLDPESDRVALFVSGCFFGALGAYIAVCFALDRR